MAIDEDNDDGLGGRFKDRQAFTAANRWARPLVALGPVAWDAAPLDEVVRQEVSLARQLTLDENWLARDRSLRRIDKLVRELEEEEIACIDAFLAAPEAASAELDAWVAGWRARLLAEGEPAIRAFGDERADEDLQRLRQLVRNARKPDAGDRAKRQLDVALRRPRS